MQQTIRIIGGRYRGKKIAFREHEGLRPTPDRVRETLFNWLMHDVRGARCLDAFAGSGALGFEAYSRDAASVVLVESATPNIASLKQQIDAWNDERLQLVHQDTRHYLQHTHDVFDIIFLDPPFAANYWLECIEYITQHQRLVEQGLLYVESPTPLNLPPEHWQVLKQKRAGQVVYALYKKISSDAVRNA